MVTWYMIHIVPKGFWPCIPLLLEVAPRGLCGSVNPPCRILPGLAPNHELVLYLDNPTTTQAVRVLACFSMSINI